MVFAIHGASGINLTYIQMSKSFDYKIVTILIHLSKHNFEYHKELSHLDSSFEYPRHYVFVEKEDH